jgi:hypothetical protein
VTVEPGVVRSIALPGYIFVSLASREANRGNAAHYAAHYAALYAARWLCGYPGIALDDTIAVGDEEADDPILEIAGKPFVRGDAEERLLKRFPSPITASSGRSIWYVMKTSRTVRGRRPDCAVNAIA